MCFIAHKKDQLGSDKSWICIEKLPEVLIQLLVPFRTSPKAEAALNKINKINGQIVTTTGGGSRQYKPYTCAFTYASVDVNAHVVTKAQLAAQVRGPQTAGRA